MDLADRIQRRRNGRADDGLVLDWNALNPASHLSEPVGRAALLEAVLDALDPVFDDQLPPSIYLWGPKGSGKSAIVSAVIHSLEAELSGRRTTYTATRGKSAMSGLRYVYVDTRRARSEFKLYHRLLNGMTDDPVPRRGIGTEDLIESIRKELTNTAGVVFAADHVETPSGAELETVQSAIERFDNIAMLAVGRKPPSTLPMPLPSEQVHVPGYSYELIDVLTVRGSRGLTRTLDHAHARAIADWSRGNAHDALGALYLAATIAQGKSASRITSEHVQAAIDEMPSDGAPLSQLLALTETEQAVITELLQIAPGSELEIDGMAHRIGEQSHLSSATVKRILYELAQADILKRVQVQSTSEAAGRRPSRVKPNFPVTVYHHL